MLCSEQHCWNKQTWLDFAVSSAEQGPGTGPHVWPQNTAGIGTDVTKSPLYGIW